MYLISYSKFWALNAFGCVRKSAGRSNGRDEVLVTYSNQPPARKFATGLCVRPISTALLYTANELTAIFGSSFRLRKCKIEAEGLRIKRHIRRRQFNTAINCF